MPLPARAHRLFADDYSSTGQIEWKRGVRGAGGPWWASDFLGQLRFDSLTSETLVLPDSHLFDGAFFLAASPERLLSRLGRGAPKDDPLQTALPIELRARRSTLRESLAELLRRDGADHLNHYVFKSIEDDQLRDAVAHELGRTPSRQLDRALARHDDPVAAVVSVLHGCLERLGARDRADEVTEPLARGWTSWLAFEAKRGLPVKRWAAGRPYRLAEALAAEQLPAERIGTDAGREARRLTELRVRQGSLYRGDISRDLSGVKRQAARGGDQEGLAEAELVERWYSRGRYRAIAWQHDAACVQVDRPWLEPLGALQALYREALMKPDGHQVPIPDGVVTGLGDMDDEAFRDLTYRHRRELTAWWREGRLDGLRQTADALTDLISIDPSRAGPVGLSELIVNMGVGAGAAAGFAVGGPLGAAVATFLGAIGQTAASRLKPPTERDRARDRILEAWSHRGGRNGDG